MDLAYQRLKGREGGLLAWARDPERMRRAKKVGIQALLEKRHHGSARLWSTRMHARKRAKKLKLGENEL